jgi:hypothetical protein
VSSSIYRFISFSFSRSRARAHTRTHTLSFVDNALVALVKCFPLLLTSALLMCVRIARCCAQTVTRILLQWGATATTSMQRRSYNSLQAHLVPLVYTLVRRVDANTGEPVEKRFFGPLRKMQPAVRHEILSLFSYFGTLSAATYRALTMCAVSDGSPSILRKVLLLVCERVLHAQPDSAAQQSALANMFSVVSTLVVEWSVHYEVASPLSPIWLPTTQHSMLADLRCVLAHLHQLDQQLDLGSGGCALALLPAALRAMEEVHDVIVRWWTRTLVFPHSLTGVSCDCVYVCRVIMCVCVCVCVFCPNS